MYGSQKRTMVFLWEHCCRHPVCFSITWRIVRVTLHKHTKLPILFQRLCYKRDWPAILAPVVTKSPPPHFNILELSYICIIHYCKKMDRLSGPIAKWKIPTKFTTLPKTWQQQYKQGIGWKLSQSVCQDHSKRNRDFVDDWELTPAEVSRLFNSDDRAGSGEGCHLAEDRWNMQKVSVWPIYCIHTAAEK